MINAMSADIYAEVKIRLRVAIREKNGIMWDKFPSGGPPPLGVGDKSNFSITIIFDNFP